MAEKRIKAYTDKFGLVKSKPIKNDEHLKNALLELSEICEIKKAYLTDGKNSHEINFSIQKQIKRPIYYTRSDKVKTYTLSIHPKYYPMIAHFADGSTEVIC